MRSHGNEKGRVIMPRQVDHQQRREHIGDAVLHLIATRGLEAASLRNVAAEAGVSMGTVQHYFTTKQDMIAFALRYNYERSTRRIPKLAAEAPGPLTTRDGARLGAAILAGAMYDDQIAETARTAYHGVFGFLTRQLAAADAKGELAPGTDPTQAALYLHAVVEGLRWPTLVGVTASEQAI